MGYHRFTSSITKILGAKTGITLKDTPGFLAVVVSSISPDSRFQGTQLRVGQMILTINGVSAKGRTARQMSQVIKEAHGKLLIISTGVPPGAPAGGLWGYQKYFKISITQGYYSHDRLLYRAPNGMYYMENGSVRTESGECHIYVNFEDANIPPLDAGPPDGRFKPHEEWYKLYEKNAATVPRVKTAVAQAVPECIPVTVAPSVPLPFNNALVVAQATPITQSSRHHHDEVPVVQAILISSTTVSATPAPSDEIWV